jgi:tRNA A-37 threonylcarbamoyl transferase component Bud32
MSVDNTDVLRHGYYSLPLPLSLTIFVDEAVQELTLTHLFRIIPGRRAVALGFCGGHKIVAKLFFETGRWQQHLQRELDGLRVMREAGIRCATAMTSGTLTGSDHKPVGAVLLMDYIVNADSLGERWQRCADEAAREAVMRPVMEEIARCHTKGLLQRDIHLDNFLLQGDRLFLLDAAAVEQVSPPQALSMQSRLDNLALFFAQFPARNDAQVPTLYRHYGQALPGSLQAGMPGADDFLKQVHRRRQTRWDYVARKLFRDTTAHRHERPRGSFVMYQRSAGSPEMDAFISRPDTFIEGGCLLKDGNSSTVAAVQVSGRQCVAKRYNIKSLAHGLSRALRPSRAWVSWRNAHMLQMFGLDTAQPILMMERRWGPLRRQAYYLSEAVEGQDALLLLREKPINSAHWQTALQQFRQLFLVMREYRIVHGDMKATNFISTPERLVILDLDAMRQEKDPRRFQKAFQRDLQRFLQNWQGAPAEEAVSQLVAEFSTHLSAPALQARPDIKG